MSNMQVNFFSLSIMRFTTFQLFLPNDTPPFMMEGNVHYDRPMKTLFLLHGYSGNAYDWGTGSIASELAAKYNLAIVMPQGDNSFYLNAKGSCFKYEDLIAVDLLNYVRQTFGIAMTPEDTLIGGLSMGGFGAIHTALKHPESFGKMFGLSSALIVNNIKNMAPGTVDPIADYDYYVHTFGDLTKLDESDNNPEYLVKERLAAGEKIQPIFMACGTEDALLPVSREFKAFLEANGVEVTYTESTGMHDWTFWNQYLEPAIVWSIQ